MAYDLLEKESEYYKLNEELQRENKKLMEEFNNVLKKQDDLLKEVSANDSKLDTLKLPNKKPKSFRTTVYLDSKENQAYVEENGKIDVDGVPHSVDEMGVKGMTQFYRSKIKVMLNEYNELQQQFKNKCEELRKTEKLSLKANEEKEKWLLAYNTNKATINKLEDEITKINSKAQTKETEIASLRKEVESLKKELKGVNLNASGLDVRLNRVLEENEKLKTELKLEKQEEKDLKQCLQKRHAEAISNVKRLEKQNMDLLNGFSKQMQLIDNLKKQKAYLEAALVTKYSEAEFSKLLDFDYKL